MFVGHFENHVLDIYCYDVNIVLIGAGLTTCKFGCTFDSRALVWLLQICFSIEAGGSAILRDTGVIVWKWPCVLPLVTCLRVMVTSHCWPFLYNYPCYLSNWHCLSLALTVEALNAWCAWWWLCFLSLCSCVISHSFTQTDKRECVLFFFPFSGWAVRPNYWSVFCIHTQLSFFSFFLSLYSMHQWNYRLLLTPWFTASVHIRCDHSISLIWRKCTIEVLLDCFSFMQV